MSIAAIAVWVACGRDEPPPEQLVLTGPTEVRVSELGPVAGPTVRLTSGRDPDGLIWTLSRPGVARLDEGRVVALGPGEVEVAAEWEGMRVTWRLAVELDTRLAFVAPPETLGVGERHPLSVVAAVGDQQLDPGAVDWSSSNPSVLSVDLAGVATGVGAGTAYVTASTRAGSAMVEIAVAP
ncbi:MAG: hypothetical protein ABMA64_15350 [Myxococcota bacterium]